MSNWTQYDSPSSALKLLYIDHIFVKSRPSQNTPEALGSTTRIYHRFQSSRRGGILPKLNPDSPAPKAPQLNTTLRGYLLQISAPPKDMQYVRSIGGSVSKTWNSINPATLSGAIDVIVVEQEDGMVMHGLQNLGMTKIEAGTLACSPFHVRFGKFSLLQPYEKKVGLFG